MAAAELPELSPRRLSKEQKTGFVLLSIFALLTLGLGVLQIRNTLYAPFALNSKVTVSLKDEVDTIDALQYRDTDQDGLNDFDELYVYTTSPYIADTDSDGKNDRQEVERGTNPLCFEGKNCATAEETLPGGGQQATQEQALAIPNPGTPPVDIDKLLGSPAEIRQLLISSGVDQALVSKISDQDLLTMTQQALSSTTTIAQLRALQGATTTRP